MLSEYCATEAANDGDSICRRLAWFRMIASLRRSGGQRRWRLVDRRRRKRRSLWALVLRESARSSCVGCLHAHGVIPSPRNLQQPARGDVLRVLLDWSREATALVIAGDWLGAAARGAAVFAPKVYSLPCARRSSTDGALRWTLARESRCPGANYSTRSAWYCLCQAAARDRPPLEPTVGRFVCCGARGFSFARNRVLCRCCHCQRTNRLQAATLQAGDPYAA
jgi:hypothetical protein